MKKLAYLAASLAFVPTLVAVSPVFASSPGNLSDGDNNYLVKNVTKNTANGLSTSATCNETVKYTVELANSEFGLISNIVVSANLQNGNMTATGTNSANATTSTTGHVDVTLDKGTLVYVPGSTVLTPIDINTRQLGTPVAKADGITAGGLNVGNLNGSTREYVQFQAKVVCETVTPPVTPPVTPVTPVTPATPKTPATPQVLAAPAVIASTGPASTALTMLGLGSLAAAATYYVRSRRNILG